MSRPSEHEPDFFYFSSARALKRRLESITEAGLVFQVSSRFCFVLIEVRKLELMAFADTRYDIQLAELIHDPG